MQIRRVRVQIETLAAITDIQHIKPHGALYNVAVKDNSVAEAIARGAEPWRGKVPLFGRIAKTRPVSAVEEGTVRPQQKVLPASVYAALPEQPSASPCSGHTRGQ